MSQSAAVSRTKQMSLEQPFKLSETISLFHRRGPADAKHRSPKVLLERQTTHIAVSVDRNRRRSAGSRQPDMPVPGQLNTERPGWRSWMSLNDGWAASEAVAGLARCDRGAAFWLWVARRRSGPIVGDTWSHQICHAAVHCNNPVDWI